MKASMMKFLAVFALITLSTATVSTKDGTITKVVKLLQDMLEKSVTEGDEERKIYGKFKCYCDQSEATKNGNIKKLTDNIEVLESKIAELQGSNGELSSEVADLKAAMADNTAAQKEATTIRDKENAAFLLEKTDLTDAIGQMKSAIETLAAVGADQTKSTGADNKQFMAGHKNSLVSVKTEVQNALKAASALMSSAQRSSAAAFVQGPFTGTYTSQSAEVMGIIKNMRDTFKANLADAITTESNSLESYNKFMKVKTDAFDKMSASYDSKQGVLSDNDGDLAIKKSQLVSDKSDKASDEEFLSKLLPLCADKAKGYENRKLLRANEEAAIAEAISILNSDAAFATFGTTSATKTGKTTQFIQLRSVRKHMVGDAHARNTVKNMLQKAAKDTHSARLSKIIAALQAENPFTTVLDQIEKMIKLIGEEAVSDKKNLDWCNDERTKNDASLADKVTKIIGLDTTINNKFEAINDQETGLLAQIAMTETGLDENTQSQATETKERTADNLAYQQDVKNLVSAQSILTKAIKVLKVYYDDLAKKIEDQEALLQKEDPDAPDAWKSEGDKADGQFGGQSEQGNKIIGMLEFILNESVKEETTAHSTEESAQHAYEDSMTELKLAEANLETSLVNLRKTLAETQKDLLDAQEDLKATTADKEAIKVYLEKIKPGCDFITTHFGERETNRATEKGALENAVNLIKDTPAYKTAVNEATVESYGDCKEPCVADAADVKCKACMADVTIPAYCAGHTGAKGCPP